MDITFQQDLELAFMMPHMHFRGKDATWTLEYPDGRKQVVLNVPRYDFNWQLGYNTSIQVPKGTKLHIDVHFDNSPNNKFNPDPSQTVYYGEMTWEEMNEPGIGPRMGRRTVLAMASLPLFAQGQSAPNKMPRSFHIDVPQSTINRILARVRNAKWPDRLDAHDWSYGANWDYMKQLAAYWTTRYDWRRSEKSLNRYPQFLARVEDYDIHFFHVRGNGPRPLPLILTHGWPGSVYEFLDAIGPLSDPARFGGSDEHAFDVIVPSLPGFGFSSKPKGKPIGPRTTARLWHKLMTETLGYTRYGAQGGDWGYAVTASLAQQYPESVVGIHLNAAGAAPVAESEQTDEIRAWQRRAAEQRVAEADYFGEQQRKPQTVAFALADNPLGTAAWIVEKMQGWSDSGDDLDKTFSKDQVLTNVMIYLVTDTAGTAVWFYRGPVEEGAAPQQGKSKVPAGFAAFPAEKAYLQPPRALLERDFNLVHYTKMPHGGHFACLEQPQLFVEDVRTFFRRVRG